MSLATRCTSCGTVFRVVQDQLKVSEGWVRCGRCNEVFNALEGLFDLERDTPPEGSLAPVGVGAASAPGSGVEQPWSIDGFVPQPGPGLVDELDTRLFGARRSESGSTRAKHLRERDRNEFSDAQFNPDWVAADDALAQDSPLAPALFEGPASSEDSAPEFVRLAQRQERWRSPVARVLLSVSSVVLLVALVLQGAQHFRDLVAARWPSLKPALVAWCGALNCRIDVPRRIEDISVESTALARAAAGDSFRLSVTLRNRGSIVLALPSIELSLNDTAGQLLARRALAPRDFRVTSTLLQPGSESALQLLLSAGNQRVSGYTVEIFYP